MSQSLFDNVGFNHFPLKCDHLNRKFVKLNKTSVVQVKRYCKSNNNKILNLAQKSFKMILSHPLFLLACLKTLTDTAKTITLYI